MTSGPSGTRFVALGDSITVGLGDGVTMGREHRQLDPARRGFAARLAPCLGPAGTVRYTNLATTGATARDVRRRQLPAALALAPQVATVVAGMNDVLKPTFDPLRLRQDLVWTVGRLRAADAIVVTATMPDPGQLLALPGPLARLLSDRVERLNAAVHAAAGRDRGVLLVDLGRHPAVRLRSTFDVDRVHPGPRGHRLIAQAFALRLADAGIPLSGLPAAVGGEQTAPGVIEHSYWLLSVGLPWLAGRCLRRTGPDGRARPGASPARAAPWTGGPWASSPWASSTWASTPGGTGPGTSPSGITTPWITASADRDGAGPPGRLSPPRAA